MTAYFYCKNELFYPTKKFLTHSMYKFIVLNLLGFGGGGFGGRGGGGGFGGRGGGRGGRGMINSKVLLQKSTFFKQ